MTEKREIGGFLLGGPHYYRLREFTLALLVIFSYLFFYQRMPLLALRPETGLVLVCFAYSVAIAGVVLEILRRFVVERVYLDHQRGQVVKQRSLFGMKQIVPLVNSEEIKAVATAGVDASLSGVRAPRSVGYLVTAKGKAVAVSETDAKEAESNRSTLRGLAESLGVPFRGGDPEQRVHAKVGGEVELKEPLWRLLRLRAVFTLPAVVLLLAFLYVSSRVLWVRFFVL